MVCWNPFFLTVKITRWCYAEWSMRQNILIASSLYPPEVGGPATHVKWLEEKLPEHGFALDICPFNSVKHLPRILRHIVYFGRLLKRVRHANVIYSLDAVSVGLPAWLVSCLSGKPLFLRLGGDYAWEQGWLRYGVDCPLDEFITKRASSRWPVRLLVSLQGWAARRATKISVQSEQMMRVVLSWGVKADKIDIIPNAVSPIKVIKSRDLLRSELKYEGLVLTTACRLVPWKGVDTLIKIIPKLRDKLGQVSLIVIGDGPEQSRLESLAYELEVSTDIKFMGRLSREQMGEMIYASDIFLLNTSYEGMSNQLLEVAGLKVPIITTNIPGNTELITDRKEGLLVTPNDVAAFIEVILQLHHNPVLRKNIINNAKEKISQFTETKIISRLSSWLKTEKSGGG